MITVVLNAIYGALIGIAGLCGIAIVFMTVLKWYKCRVILHSCWCLFCLIMIITFIISSIFTFISLVGFDICEVLNKSLTEKGYMSNYSQISADIQNKLNVCSPALGGNGNILKEFGVEDQLNKVKDLQNNLTNF